MESGNVAQILIPGTTVIQQRNFTQGQESDAEFLSLKLLNKRGRVRLSTHPIECSRLPGKPSLLAIGNRKAYLAAAVRNDEGSFILLSTLSEFRTAAESGQPKPEPFIPFAPQRSLLRVPGIPHIIKFALHDERLIIGFIEGPILVYITDDLYASTRTQLDPVHVFPGDASTIPRDIVPNPGESPELVAILRGVHGQEPGHQVDVLDIHQLKHIAGWRKGSDINTAPVSISWSPKGKQIAIGLQSGDILSYSPLSSGSPKSHLPRPPSIPPTASSLLSTTWLTNASFHAVFSSPEASSSLFDASKSSSLTKTHIISTHDSKSQTVIDVELQDPSPPFGAPFPPGPLSIVLRNWSPTKFIVICGDGPSPDIGLIGSLSSEGSPDAWVNFTLEETSTPSLPLGEDTQDMALLGMEIDLTSSKSVRISEQPDDGTPDLPPSPILYAYMSDGTVVAWHVLNTTGNVYPGMGTSKATEASTSSQLMIQQKVSMEESGMSSPRMSPRASPKPALLSPAAQPQSISAFGQTPSSSPSTSIAPAKGFGAFGNVNTPSKFGSTGFGFAGGSDRSAFGTSAFGSSGFGGGSEAKTLTTTSSPFGSSGFGQTSTAPAFGASGFGSKSITPAFGVSSFGSKPAAPSGFGSPGSSGSASMSSTGGFAAFANQGTSAFGTPVGSAFSTEPQRLPYGTTALPSSPQSAFGTGGSGPAGAPASAFGAGGSGLTTSFGQQQPVVSATFGQPTPASAFGAPSFGKPAAPAFGQSGFSSSSLPKSSISSTGGFAAFASQGTSTFGTSAGSGISSESKSMQSSPFGTAPSASNPQSAFGAGGSGQASTAPTSVFGAVKSGQATAPLSSAFGAGASSPASTAPASAFGTEEHKGATSFGQGQQQPEPSSPFGSFGSKAATSTFGQTGFGTNTSSATSQGGAFSNFGTLGDSLNKHPEFDSPPGSPPSPGGSPPGSPKHPSQPTKPASSYLKPAEGFGALVKSSGAFETPKPIAPGAFGSSSQKSTSSLPKSVVPAFSPTTSGPTPISPSTVTPTFGSTSALGGSRPVFGSSTFGAVPQTATSEPSKSISGGFGAFSSGVSSFASFANVAKSTNFDDILSSPDKDKPKSTGSPLVFGPSNAKSSSAPLSTTSAEQVATSNTREEDVDDVASEPFSLTDDGFDESASAKSSRSPTRSLSEGESEAAENIPLPETPTPRSTPASTPTPLPPPPKISVPDASPPVSTPSASTAERPNTTTPPGSPEKPEVPIATPPAPKPLFPTSTVSPFGLVRPSSRPIRSSPLASAPITSTDAEDSAPDVTPSKSAPATVDVEPAEPKRLLERVSSPAQVPYAEPSIDSGKVVSSPASRRPKTPPLLDTPTSGTATLRSPFVLGQPQVLPVPLKPSSLPVPLSIPTSVNHRSAGEAREEEEEIEEIPKNPMQVEFQRVYMEMVKELVQLYKKAQEMAYIRPAISEPRGLDKLVLNNQDFIPGKYSHGDLKSFTIMIGSLQKKVVPLLDQGKANKNRLQDLQNLALISATKQEELSRWARAQEDPEFAKTLKPRSLGPEHSENQTRLRKALQIAHDRIQQCEDELESLKKRLEQHKSGKVGMRPPSLDTIDRTCRNIQIALEERTKLLEQLSDRTDALSPQASQRLYSSTTQPRAPYHQKPGVVTPPFASVAAAALNSERSSLNLKNSLLSARKEPLLTTNVVKFKTSMTVSPGPQVTQRPEWKLPPVPPLSTTSSSVNRRNVRPGKKHGAVPLKTSMPGSDAKSIAFDWGPLPGVAPMDQLSRDVRSQRTGGPIKLTKQELDDDGEWEEAVKDYERQ